MDIPSTVSKILVTGGCGFIGSNFVKHLRRTEPEIEVVVLDDLSTGRVTNLDGEDVDVRVGSVADVDALNEAMLGVDSVVHLAALGSVPRSIDAPLASHVANLTGTLNVMEGARRAGAYVAFASSSSVYGANLNLPKSEYDWTRPMSPYGVTKLGAEGYVLAYQYAYGLPTLAFRFFNVYGPYQPADHAYAAVIPRFIDAALAGRPLQVHGDGMQSRDFTHVESVCAALHQAVTRRVVSSDPVNLAFGTSTTLLELIGVLRVVIDRPLNIEHIESRVGDIRASQSDGVRLRELFPDVMPVPLDEGIASTAAWFRSSTAETSQ